MTLTLDELRERVRRIDDSLRCTLPGHTVDICYRVRARLAFKDLLGEWPDHITTVTGMVSGEPALLRDDSVRRALLEELEARDATD